MTACLLHSDMFKNPNTLSPSSETKACAQDRAAWRSKVCAQDRAAWRWSRYSSCFVLPRHVEGPEAAVNPFYSRNQWSATKILCSRSVGTMGIWRLIGINEYFVCVLGGWAGLFCSRHSDKSVLTEIIVPCVYGWVTVPGGHKSPGLGWTQEAPGVFPLEFGFRRCWLSSWVCHTHGHGPGWGVKLLLLCEMRAHRLWISLSCLLWMESLSPHSPHGLSALRSVFHMA